MSPSNKNRIPSAEEQKESGFVATYSSDQFVHCCGIVEFGSLTCIQKFRWQTRRSWATGQLTGEWIEHKVYPSIKEAWQAVLSQMRERAEYSADEDDGVGGSFPMVFNIIMNKSETDPLRELLKEQSDCNVLYEWENPNTGNRLEMIMLTNGSENNDE